MIQSFPEARPQGGRISAGTMPYMTGSTPTGFDASAGAPANTAAVGGSVTPTQPPHQPPPTGYNPYGPIPPQGPPPRRGTTIAIVTAIIVAGALIAGALLFRGGGTQSTSTPSAEVSAPTVVQPGPASPAPTGLSTCEAWAVAGAKMDAYPRFPAGWTYDTPGIKEFIEGRNAAITEILNTFEQQIQPSPENVKILAQTVLERARAQSAKLSDGTWVEDDSTLSVAAIKALNQACGLG